MPAQLDTNVAATVVAAAPLIEIESGICGIVSPRLARTGGLSQIVDERDPSLGRRIRDFWPDRHSEFVELFVVLERHGLALHPDPDAVLARLPELLAESFPVPELPSEEPGVREIVQERLDRLAASPEARDEYRGLLQGVWDIGRPIWLERGRATAEAAVRELEARIERGESPADLLPRKHLALHDAYRDLISGNEPLVITPFGLNLAVKYILQVRGGPVYVGFGPAVDLRDELRRERAEESANAFKVFSDATRLSILDYLLHVAASVSDLARVFEVSQPTISAHVKMLREAGLLKSTRSGTHTLYRADRPAVQALIDKGSSALSGIVK